MGQRIDMVVVPSRDWAAFRDVVRVDNTRHEAPCTRSRLLLATIFLRNERSVTLLAVEIAYSTKDIRKVCQRAHEAEARLGPNVARRLRNRLADLRAVDSIDDLPTGNPQHLDHESVAIELGDGYRVIVVENHNPARRDANGNVDWPQVKRVKVVAIEKDD